jgi:hypothetical protein
MGRLRWVVLTLFVMGAVTIGATAQTGTASPKDVARCVQWLKDLLPQTIRIDPAEFCAGVKPEGAPDGFSAFSVAQHCGPEVEKPEGAPRPYCTSSGILAPGWTIAAGYTAASQNGNELFSETRTGRGAWPAPTLYSRTPLHVGALRLAAGLYRLEPSHTSDGWMLTVVSEPEDSTAPAQQPLGTITLKADTRFVSDVSGSLGITLHDNPPRCDHHARELAFTYNATDLYTCLLPEPVPPAQENAANR